MLDESMNVVREHPPPPAYYNGRTYCSSPHPPPLSELASSFPSPASISNTLLHGQFKGLVTMQLHTRKDYNKTKNYKEELKRLLNQIVSESFVAADSITYEAAVQDSVIKLQDTIQQLHNSLSEYRTHAARQLLIEELKYEFQTLSSLEVALIQLLQKETN